MQKILFIQTSFLGDVILATALIEKWRVFYPEDRIDMLVRKGNEGVFADNPILNKLLIWNKARNKYYNLWKMAKEIRSNKYDKIFNLQRFASTGILTVLSGAREVYGFEKNPFAFSYTRAFPHEISAFSKLHETARNQTLIEQFTDATPAKPRIYVNTTIVQKVSKIIPERYIVIAPASVWYTKQYPKEKWISFLSKLDTNVHVVFIGSSADRMLCARIIAEAGLKNQGLVMKNLSGELSIQESAELMRNAMMNYVNDSAPLHMASSVNAPVAAIYCSTVPEFGFGPLSDNQVIIQINEKLYCRPCGLHGKKACPEHHFRCAMDIDDEDLTARLKITK